MTDYTHVPKVPNEGIPQVPNQAPSEADAEPADHGFEDPGDGRVWRNWYTPFLNALAVSANVSQSARAAGISRQHANRERRKEEHFAVLCREAEEQAADLLRQTARLLGVTGEEVTTVREEFDADGKLVARVLTTKKVRDTALLVRQLQAYCPEFRDQRDVRLGGIAGASAVPVVVDTRRTPERIRDLVEAMLEVGVDMDTDFPGFEIRRRPVDGSSSCSAGSAHAA